MLTKPIKKHGNTGALLMDQTMLKLLGAEIGTQVKVSFDNARMIIEPLSQDEIDQLAMQAAGEVLNEHDGLFEKLAR